MQKLRTPSLKNDMFFYGTAIGAERFISFLIIPLLTKTLPQEIYGVWTQIIITTGLMSPVVLLGFPSAMVRFISGKKDNQEKSTLFHGMLGIESLNLFLVTALIIILKPFLGRMMFGDARFFDFIYLFGFFLAADALFELTIAFLWADKQIRLLSIYSFLKNGIRIGILALAILLFHIDLFHAIIFIVVVQFLLVICVYINHVFKKVGFSIWTRKVRWREIMLFSFPLIPYSVFIWTNNFVDRYFILHILNINRVSIYAVSYSLAAVIGVFYSVLGFTIYPHMAALWNEGDKIGASGVICKAIRYYFFFAVPSIAGLTILSAPIIKIVSTAEYFLSWQVIFWLCLGIAVFGLYELNVFAILLAKKTILNLKITAVALVVNVILNIIMIPRIGILGAAVSTCVSNSVLAFWTIAVSKRYLPYGFPWRDIAKIVLATTIMSLFLLTVTFNISINNFFTLGCIIVLGLGIYGSIDMLSKNSFLLELVRR
jgi:O-antigen/teichoic acid export membrane protein